MLELTGLPTVVQALALVIAVAVEAVALYVGFGYLEQLLGPRVLDTIENV